ncbi:MAG: hypothetical protein M1829_001607 [Trizodia sp. TS-e1964]|nr:MAG: hypothetical protein M1829_001607 [Trizodia sp. TS-e1964]
MSTTTTTTTTTDPPPPPFRWLLDTRTLWPTTSTSDFPAQAARALSLLPPPTRTAILAHHHPSSQRTALASALLKRHAIAHASRLPWPLAHPTLSPLHKPLSPHLQFNLSHQAGLLVLIGIPNGAAGAPAPEVGIDVVCVGERDDHAAVREAGGWAAWVHMFREVLGDADADAVLVAPEGLRAFYAFWAVREAFLKLRGEGLLARYVREVRVVGLRVPRPAGGEGVWGERVGGVGVCVGGERQDVRVEVQAWGKQFVVATAVAGRREGGMPAWREVRLDVDVLPFAEAWEGGDEGDLLQ